MGFCNPYLGRITLSVYGIEQPTGILNTVHVLYVLDILQVDVAFFLLTFFHFLTVMSRRRVAQETSHTVSYRHPSDTRSYQLKPVPVTCTPRAPALFPSSKSLRLCKGQSQGDTNLSF